MEQLAIHFEPDDEQLGFVYFIQSGQDGPIKIGFTQNVLSRFRALHTSSPLALRLLGAIPGSRATEKELHRRFSSERIRLNAEWFTPSPELLEMIQTAEMPLEFDQNGIPLTRPPKAPPEKKLKPAREPKPVIEKSKKSRIRKTVKTYMGRPEDLLKWIGKSGFSLHELSELSGVELRRIEAALNQSEEMARLAMTKRFFTLEQTRAIGRVLNVQFMAGYQWRQDKNSKPRPEIFFSCESFVSLLEQKSIPVLSFLEKISDNLLLEIDMNTNEIVKSLLVYISPDNDAFDGVYQPILVKRELSFDDICDLASNLEVVFY